jgi:GT2 family glycosyltransferase
MQSFSIIIVSWNALEHLKTFLPSVCDTSYPKFEIILADNASSDDSAAWVRTHFPQVRVVSLDKNYGYCGGNNRAAGQARYDNLVFLNNDVEVSSDWLIPVARMLSDQPNVAVIQPKLRSYVQKSHFEYAGAAGGFLDAYGYPFCRGRLFDTVEEDLGQYDTATPIFWASGAAMVIRRRIFEECGGFEERFEFHMEEIDLCWRVQHMGKQVWYCPQSVVYHLGGGSLPTNSARKVFYNFRNNLWMIRRNLNGLALWKVLLVRAILDDLAVFRFVIAGEFKLGISANTASFLGNLSRIQKPVRTSENALYKPELYQKSIVYQYFIRKVKRYSDLP